MLFNSFIFIFGFLPLTLVVFYVLGRWRQDAAKVALTLLSLGFYAWWRPVHLPILLFSIVFNYLVGGRIQKAFAEGASGRVRAWLGLGIVVDLSMLGWFKYANFVVDNIDLLGAHITLAHIALPLAISFFTFQKIAYLMDSANGEAKAMSFLNFSLFAAFFPQLIAGPIVHYKEVVPQLQRRLFTWLRGRDVMVGLVMFAMGLFKKTVIADTIAVYANPMFDSARGGGHPVGLAYGWLAALTYTLQLYFDFSGYSDMAIGLGRMLGVKLPLNFHSPLRAASISDYWRRWHMTLQRFIVAYVFQPLSLPLNRFAANRGLQGWTAFLVATGAPVFITFVAIGVWHGAGWTFALFGAMHAVYIGVNEAWRELGRQRRRRARRAGRVAPEPGRLGLLGYHLLTLAAVMFANVVFRAATVPDAVRIWSGMIGLNGLYPAAIPGYGAPLPALIVAGFLVVFLMPNTQQILGRFDPAYDWAAWRDVGRAPLSWTWKPDLAGLAFAGVALFLGVIFIERGRAVFLYFNF
jgi:D-alanyl-lipoteichoic acid acyltransferase DltB (MBOAT superfamily)